MKKYCFILLLFCHVAIYAQHAGKPLYFLDSVSTTTLPLFDPNKIESITVLKAYDSVTQTDGKIYITSKKDAHFNFFTLPQVAQQQQLSPGNCLFMIDDVFVKDLRDIKIDTSYILRCEVTSTKDITYLQSIPALAILNIKTKSGGNMKQEGSIRIRGSEFVLSGWPLPRQL
jgi:hypothetical protein